MKEMVEERIRENEMRLFVIEVAASVNVVG